MEPGGSELNASSSSILSSRVCNLASLSLSSIFENSGLQTLFLNFTSSPTKSLYFGAPPREVNPTSHIKIYQVFASGLPEVKFSLPPATPFCTFSSKWSMNVLRLWSAPPLIQYVFSWLICKSSFVLWSHWSGGPNGQSGSSSSGTESDIRERRSCSHWRFRRKPSGSRV